MNKQNNFHNQFVLTNKSLIEKKEIPSEEEQQKNDLKFLYQLTGKDFKLSDLKKDIGIFLELTDYIFNDIKSISEAGKNVKNMEYSSDQKMNNESLYNNKVKCFNNNLNLFQKKFEFIKEQNNGFKKVFEFINKLKYFGFLLDEKFNIDENDMILDLNKIIIQHKWINNFEELINIQNKHFRIINNENGEPKLISDFFNYYNNKYELNFDLEIKINNTNSIHLANSFFRDYMDNKIDKVDKDNNIKEMLLFYIKYLLYKFFKEEMNALLKSLKMESKETQFLHKGLTFNIKKTFNKIILKCNYFENIDINFYIWKMEKNEYKEDKDISDFIYSFNKERKKINFINLNDFEKKINKFNIKIIIKIMKFVKIFLSNILFDIKISKNITNFIGEIKKNNNLILENIIKNSSIFVKNISNLGLILLKDILFNYLNNFNNFYFIANHLNLFETPLGKFRIHFEYFEKGMKLTYIIELLFDINLNLSIYIKEPYKNNIFNLDQGQGIYLEKGRINFNYIFEVISSCVSNFEIDKNRSKFSFRNTIL